MNGRWRLGLCTALVLSLVLGGLAGAAPGTGKSDSQRLNMYRAIVGRAELAELNRSGVDVANAVQQGGAARVDLVLTSAERARLAARGIETRLLRGSGGKSVAELAAEQAAGGYNVWRSFDEPGGIRDELYRIAARNPDVVKLEVLGHSLNGRPIIALKLTKEARTTPDNARPAVLYMSLQHAREWISVEVNRRLLHHFIRGWRTGDQATRHLLRTRELWFVVVANPDGYEYTFDVERLWRKNLRDNDGDGEITTNDGVDPNRNYPEHWGYDNEGSSTQFSAADYRGTGPVSEPETQAMVGLMNRVDFEFLNNYHSYGALLLYPFGWQVLTRAADNPLFEAYSGTPAEPAIPGFLPELGAELYITNGETTDYAYTEHDMLAWTPELNEGCEGCGFIFPDDEELIQEEFEKNLPFALDMAWSAPHPGIPTTHLGNTVKPMYPDTFQYSYGDPQVVQVTAKRNLGAVFLNYRINQGHVKVRRTSEFHGGERYGAAGDVYYREMRGKVRGTQPGDEVKVWFTTRKGSSTDPFTYTAEVESDADVLVLANEDYTGISPEQDPAGPHYLSYYLDALQANGIEADVYDIDARNRIAPDALGVLGHYDLIVWYTGDDIITRDEGMVPGTASKIALDTLLAVRDRLNEGGKVFYTGKHAGLQYADAYEVNPNNNEPCDPESDADLCIPLSDDFLQYYLGAYLYNSGAGVTDTGDIYDVLGIDTPLAGLEWSINGDDSANNQDNANSFISTSGILDPQEFPQFTSWPSSRYDRPGGPFEPHTGEKYMYSQIGDVSYKRVTRTISVPAEGATMSFWTSYDTEPDWDYLFVEARTAGGDDWTTLADQNGHTTQATGDSCSSGWRELHPHLDHYQTLDEATGTCTPTGTTGEWNASTGNSGGWEQWTVDLSQWVGGDVEVSIAYASDWASQGLGVFVDDIEVSTGEGNTSFEDDADPADGWEVTGPPPGSAPNPNNFVRTTSEGFPEGASISTNDSVYFGFGLEGIQGATARAEVMGRVADYLLSGP